MRISNNFNSPNFGIRIDKNFKRSANNFYFNKDLSIQQVKLTKKIEQLESIGDENSLIKSIRLKENGELVNILCFINRKFDNKQALIMEKSRDFNDILKFFIDLTPEKIEAYEDLLAK